MMKKLITVFCLVALSTMVLSCRAKRIKDVNEQLTEGNWVVTNYEKDNSNLTADFTGDTFTFLEDGTLSISGTHTVSGIWWLQKEVPGQQKTKGAMRPIWFTISIASPFDEVPGIWEVGAYGDRNIVLVNTGGEINDYLTFTVI